jgi:hypothetical protein
LRRIFALALTLGCVAAVAARVQGATPAPAIPPEIRRVAESLRESCFTGTRASEWARGLVDTAGPRLSGSPGDKAAIA